MQPDGWVMNLFGVMIALVLFGIPIIAVLAHIFKRQHCDSCKDNAKCDRKARRKMEQDEE
jgi:hypothetical protein